MKKTNQLKLLICALTLASANARVVFTGTGPAGSRSSNTSTTGSISVGSSSTSTSVECRRDNAISYGFLKTLLLGDTPKFTVANGKVLIDIPTHVSACLSDISAQAISNPVDNNIYLKFNVTLDSSVYPAGTESVEKEYEKCLNHLSGGDSSFFNVDKLNANGHLASPMRIIVDQPTIDSSKNSELVIASTNKDLEYRNDMPFGLANVAQHTSFSDPSFNCMDFAKPAESKIMANKTQEYRLREEAIAACNGKNLVDIAMSLSRLRSDSGGNYDDLTRLLSGIQFSLIDQEAKELIEKMEQIEHDISPTTEDVTNGDKFGVSKDKMKKLLTEYAGYMDKFSKELLPSLKAELSHLMAEYEDLGESEADERRKTEINESIEKMNDLISKFNRQNENGQEYKRLVEGLREENMQTSGRKILSGIILAAEFSNAKLEGTGKQSVEKAESNSTRAIERLRRGTLADWGDEALIRAGDRSPIARRRKVMQEIQSRASRDQQRFQQRLSSYDDYIKQYANDLVSSYCTSGGNYQDCMTVQNTYVPYIANQYMGWRQNAASDYSTQYSNTFGAAYQEQQSVLNRFNNIYATTRLNNLQNQFNSSTGAGNFNLWTGAESSYSTGIPGLDFNFSGLGNNTQQSNFGNNFNLMGTQQRAPGSSNWSNPYAR